MVKNKSHIHLFLLFAVYLDVLSETKIWKSSQNHPRYHPRRIYRVHYASTPVEGAKVFLRSQRNTKQVVLSDGPSSLSRSSGRFYRKINAVPTHEISTAATLKNNSILNGPSHYSEERHHKDKLTLDEKAMADANLLAKGMARTTMRVKMFTDIDATTTPLPQTSTTVKTTTTVAAQQQVSAASMSVREQFVHQPAAPINMPVEGPRTSQFLPQENVQQQQMQQRQQLSASPQQGQIHFNSQFAAQIGNAMNAFGQQQNAQQHQLQQFQQRNTQGFPQGFPPQQFQQPNGFNPQQQFQQGLPPQTQQALFPQAPPQPPQNQGFPPQGLGGPQGGLGLPQGIPNAQQERFPAGNQNLAPPQLLGAQQQINLNQNTGNPDQSALGGGLPLVGLPPQFPQLPQQPPQAAQLALGQLPNEQFGNATPQLMGATTLLGTDGGQSGGSSTGIGGIGPSGGQLGGTALGTTPALNLQGYPQGFHNQQQQQPQHQQPQQNQQHRQQQLSQRQQAHNQQQIAQQLQQQQLLQQQIPQQNQLQSQQQQISQQHQQLLQQQQQQLPQQPLPVPTVPPADMAEVLDLAPLSSQSANSSLEVLGCGWDIISNSCKDVFNINWCSHCHDFGNVFLHDCKCVNPNFGAIPRAVLKQLAEAREGGNKTRPPTFI